MTTSSSRLTPMRMRRRASTSPSRGGDSTLTLTRTRTRILTRTRTRTRTLTRWSLALHAFPRARFLAKTDDDSLNNFANLAGILTNPTLVPRGPGRSVELHHLLPLGRGRSPSPSLSLTPEP